MNMHCCRCKFLSVFCTKIKCYYSNSCNYISVFFASVVDKAIGIYRIMAVFKHCPYNQSCFGCVLQ